MAKRRANGQMSDSELELRRFHRQVKRVKKYCADQDIELMIGLTLKMTNSVCYQKTNANSGRTKSISQTRMNLISLLKIVSKRFHKKRYIYE